MLENSITDPATSPAAGSFHSGDRIYLAKGSYEGTTGIFLQLKADPKWADIREPNDSIRAHPVEWMALSGAPAAQK